ncbi:hypothetical protein B0T26DRAFT_750551 [Lasiosphaeria miniovina]|uniref:Uncharacterized protein n=1 Tax=Lasiosphaeria miniovina TaxID=1954250 RepID=A0AA40AWD6_9PEZI|nr:uncharacterized protein B0T26DRAFT_750551 [Lasiosphaeria miniovina]KAK0723265.1 hypothetical protein B0T26DRAFT_750551 [Lasiosphaeria miniovina]
MKLIQFLIASILPFSIFAMPNPAPAASPTVDETVVAVEAVEAVGYSEKRDEPSKLFARDRVCRINGSGRVNCRSCPSTSCSAPYYVVGGSSYNFDCAAAGECVTIGGVTNCNWDRTVAEGCYVSAYYTDSGCTVANLGRC